MADTVQKAIDMTYQKGYAAGYEAGKQDGRREMEAEHDGVFVHGWESDDDKDYTPRNDEYDYA